MENLGRNSSLLPEFSVPLYTQNYVPRAFKYDPALHPTKLQTKGELRLLGMSTGIKECRHMTDQRRTIQLSPAHIEQARNFRELSVKLQEHISSIVE